MGFHELFVFIHKALPSLVRELFLLYGISLNDVIISKGFLSIVREGFPSIVRGFPI